MNQQPDIDLSKRKFSARLIVERALARGWRVQGFETNTAIHLLYPPGRPDAIRIFSASPPQMSHPAAKIAQDKYITNQILQNQGLPVPEELLINVDDPLNIESLKEFLDKHKQLVVKPLDASHGKGVTTNVVSVEQLHKAIDTAKQATEKSRILLQQQLQGLDIRITVIGYEYADAINRIPASVKGDGVHNLEQLINLENQRDDRGENYSARLNIIPPDKAREFLGSDGMAYVPGDGETIQVIGVANVGMGGERNNIKDDIPKYLRQAAEAAAKALGLPVCGVDFIVRELPSVSSTPEQLQARIIELNECPMLTMYEDLYSPQQLALIDKYLDYIAAS